MKGIGFEYYALRNMNLMQDIGCSCMKEAPSGNSPHKHVSFGQYFTKEQSYYMIIAHPQCAIVPV